MIAWNMRRDILLGGGIFDADLGRFNFIGTEMGLCGKWKVIRIEKDRIIVRRHTNGT